MKMNRRHAVLGFSAMGIGAAVMGRGAVSATRPATAFGTTIRLTVSARTSAAADAALDAGFREIRAVEKAFSLFDANSELSRLNATAELSDPSAMMIEMVGLASHMNRVTRGAFEPSVQPLWTAWQESLAQSVAPDKTQIERAVARVGWHNLEIAQGQLRLTQSGTALTFNGIAQGYAADRVMKAISPLIVSAFIDTGELGLLLSGDEPRLAIRHPRYPERPVGYVRAPSGFVATSGDYATVFSADYVHHHIFDPIKGVSPRELSAVTVLAPQGATADALATAFMVMGSARALALAEILPGVETLLITKGGEIKLSSGMNRLFQST
jgi:FAD:protein FMN transferase